MNWQLPEQSHVYRFKILTILIIYIPAGLILATRHGYVAPVTLLLAMGAQALLYAAITDYRERWIPDHVTTPMLLIGLAWHPLTDIPGSIDGIITCSIAAFLWFGAFAFNRTHTIEFNALSGGDLYLAASIGSWLGPINGMIALCVAAIMHALMTPLVILLKRLNKLHAVKIIGYDPDTHTIPLAPILAFSFILAALYTPDPMPDLTPLIQKLENQRAAFFAEQQYEKQHPADMQTQIDKKLQSIQTLLDNQPSTPNPQQP